jgi:hypothetical protein
MGIYHIIEQTVDQQVVEVTAKSQQDALTIYLNHSTRKDWNSITRKGSNIIVDYPTETCILWAKTDGLIYAKWISKQGLY